MRRHRATKSSREVVQAVLDAGLAEVEHELWPLSSLKGTERSVEP